MSPWMMKNITWETNQEGLAIKKHNMTSKIVFRGLSVHISEFASFLASTRSVDNWKLRFLLKVGLLFI